MTLSKLFNALLTRSTPDSDHYRIYLPLNIVSPVKAIDKLEEAVGELEEVYDKLQGIRGILEEARE